MVARDKEQKNQPRRAREAGEAAKDNESRCREKEGARGMTKRDSRVNRETVLYTPMRREMSSPSRLKSVVVAVVVAEADDGE